MIFVGIAVILLAVTAVVLAIWASGKDTERAIVEAREARERSLLLMRPDGVERWTQCPLHDSTRRDGSLDDHCLRCGAGGYWHEGHRHELVHPSGKVLFCLGCSG